MMVYKNLNALDTTSIIFEKNRNMSTKNTVVCPTCHTEIDLDAALTARLEDQIRASFEAEQRQWARQVQQRESELKMQQDEFEAKRKRENEIIMERIKKETEAKTKVLEVQLRNEIAAQHEQKIQFLQKQQQESEQKLKQLQQQELEILQLNKKIQEQQEQEEFKLKKQRLDIESELKEKLTEDILQKEREKFDLEKRELEKQLQDQKKLTETMTRKLEQGSMQTQGEVQELKLEEMLQHYFPFDVVQEVGKGKRGADCILVIRNDNGQEAGRVIFESKRTSAFNKEWLSKLKEDMLEAKCDVSVLVTQAMPDDLKGFDQREGVWICKMMDVIQLVKALREGILNVARARKFNENKGEKKEMLYTYFTSNEFMQQMRAINEAYLYLKSSIDKERLQMERIWKEREKQIDRVLLNNTHLIGTIKGIAGDDVNEALLEGE